MTDITLSPDNPLLLPGSLTLAPVRTKSATRGPQISTLRYRTSRAVSPGQCPLGDSDSPGGHPVISLPIGDSGLSGQAAAICLIQRVSGCRIGEVLRLTSDSIILPDMLIIKASKGSRHRSIRIPELMHEFIRHKAMKHHLLFSVSYSHLYRLYKGAGIIQYLPDKPRNRVTHSLRQSFIQNIQLACKDVSVTQDVVGHKSKRSTIIYLQKGTHNG